jgi:hypothetical protein
LRVRLIEGTKDIAVCTLLLMAVLLWPFDFEWPGVSVPNGAAWRSGSGAEFHALGILSTSVPPTEFYSTMIDRDSGPTAEGFTIEVWAASFSQSQRGPARLVSASDGVDERNFMLGQSGSAVVLRLRTTRTDSDGSTTLKGQTAEFTVPGAFAGPGLHHLVVTDDLLSRRAFVDGKEVLAAPSPGGNFSSWSYDLPLHLGNEAGGTRPWAGRLALVALYDRALDAHEVAANFQAGSGEMAEPVGRVADSLVLEYPLAVRSPEPLGLVAPAMIETPVRRPQFVPYAEVLELLRRPSALTAADLLGNILLFVPFGFLLRRRMSGMAAVVLVGMAFSGTMETAQLFIEPRFPSFTDVINNGVGSALGAVSWELWDRRRRFSKVRRVDFDEIRRDA